MIFTELPTLKLFSFSLILLSFYDEVCLKQIFPPNTLTPEINIKYEICRERERERERVSYARET